MENIYKISEILYPGKSVQIDVKNIDGAKLTRKATVNRLDESNLILNLPNQEKIFERVHPNAEIAVICKHQNDQPDYVFFTKFFKVLGTTQPIAILRAPHRFNKGRKVARYNVTIPFSYFFNNREYKGEMVHNLSMNGLLATISPNQRLKERERVAFKLFIPNNDFPLLLSGNITRIIKQDQKYQIALHFQGIPFDIQEKIVKYLFSVQKTFRRKALESRTNFPKNVEPPFRKIG